MKTNVNEIKTKEKERKPNVEEPSLFSPITNSNNISGN